MTVEEANAWAEAIAHFEQALAIFRGLGDRDGEGQALTNLGNAYRYQGRWAEAIDVYHQSPMIKHSPGDLQGEGVTRTNLGDLYEDQGEKAKAQPLHREALTKLHPDSPGYRKLRQRLG